MKTQAQLKALKKEIVTETAINVGYREEVLNRLPVYAITEAVREISMQSLGIKSNTSSAEIQNIIVTEAVKVMSFQDFKEIAKFFFNYNRLSA